MNRYITFDDVLLLPKYSTIHSRSECNTNTVLGNNISSSVSMNLPIISANMDTVTEDGMSIAMTKNGGMGALHRFMSIEKNIQMFKKNPNCFVSFGASNQELVRARALYEEGARYFILDVAHGASEIALNAYNEFVASIRDNGVHVMVGNFATAESIRDFVERTNRTPDSFKVGIGGGSMCTTRIVTGVGVPTLSSVMDCVKTGLPVVADGGIRNSGDVSKCLAAGASAVMVGSLLSGTEETPGEMHYHNDVPYKSYRGSASKESYEVQGKTAQHRTPEGESTLVKCKGSVDGVLQTLKAGLTSSMSYLNAKNLSQFRENATFIEITTSAAIESRAHGK